MTFKFLKEILSNFLSQIYISYPMNLKSFFFLYIIVTAWITFCNKCIKIWRKHSKWRRRRWRKVENGTRLSYSSWPLSYSGLPLFLSRLFSHTKHDFSTSSPVPSSTKHPTPLSVTSPQNHHSLILSSLTPPSHLSTPSSPPPQVFFLFASIFSLLNCRFYHKHLSW